MKWERLGHRFVPDGFRPWARSHASTPWGSWREDGLLRVYFTSRDAGNRSHIGWVDLDPDTAFMPVAESDLPVVAPGAPGLFDDSGVAMGCLVEDEGRDLLFYVGWNLRVTVPWSNTIGLAVRDHGSADFVKHGRVPVMDRSEEDPFSMSYPVVLRDGDGLTMFYGTNGAWGSAPESMMHGVARATSSDGIDWTRDREPVLRPIGPLEYAISRPMVRQTLTGLEMFYCHRASAAAESYRIGWATSDDGRDWTRRDHEVGFDVAGTGWDSEMLCYPFVFDHDGTTFMLYNGNGYGLSGFGLAALIDGAPASSDQS